MRECEKDEKSAIIHCAMPNLASQPNAYCDFLAENAVTRYILIPSPINITEPVAWLVRRVSGYFTSHKFEVTYANFVYVIALY